jgi:predicted kinase
MTASHHGTPEALILVGVQGAGKSSFYRERFFHTHIRISLDVVGTRHREQLIFEACLRAGQSFVIDNTNPLPADRARYIEPSREAGFGVTAYYFRTSLQDAIRRNNQREAKQKVPVAAVGGTFKKLQPPTMAEGFDSIYTVELRPDNQFVVVESSD